MLTIHVVGIFRDLDEFGEANDHESCFVLPRRAVIDTKQKREKLRERIKQTAARRWKMQLNHDFILVQFDDECKDCLSLLPADGACNKPWCIASPCFHCYQ